MDDPLKALRPTDIAWQAYQRGVHDARRFPLAILSASELLEESGSKAMNVEYVKWWKAMRELGHGPCAMCHFDAEQIVTQGWDLFIPREPPGMNARVINSGKSAHLYRRERDAWCMWFRAEKLRQRLPIATDKRRVVMTRLYGGRQQERDRDNLIGGMKCIVDAMVIEKLLVDDAPRYAELHYQQRSEPMKRGLEVRLEEVC